MLLNEQRFIAKDYCKFWQCIKCGIILISYSHAVILIFHLNYCLLRASMQVFWIQVTIRKLSEKQYKKVFVDIIARDNFRSDRFHGLFQVGGPQVKDFSTGIDRMRFSIKTVRTNSLCRASIRSIKRCRNLVLGTSLSLPACVGTILLNFLNLLLISYPSFYAESDSLNT